MAVKIISDTFRISGASRSLFVNVLCECGNVRNITMTRMRKNPPVSCGCQRIKNTIKHGLTRTPIHEVWSAMRKRCLMSWHQSYKDYGGRGISICEEWKDNLTAFNDWAQKNGWMEGLQIERINNDGNYEPSNCKWATIKEQSRNRRSTKLSLDKAKEIRERKSSHTLRELAGIYGVNISCISKVINNKRWT